VAFFQFRLMPLLVALVLCMAMADAAWANRGNNGNNGNGNGNGRPTEVDDHDDDDDDDGDDDDERGTRTIRYTLTSERRVIIVDTIYGTNQYGPLISNELRRAILNDAQDLPPGIRRQYLEGRTLPPGIAKKHELPDSIAPLIDLGPHGQVVVVGRDIVIIDRRTQAIWDIAEGAL